MIFYYFVYFNLQIFVIIDVLHAIIKVFGCVIHVAVNLKYSLKGMLRTATTEFLSVETLASSSSMV